MPSYRECDPSAIGDDRLKQAAQRQRICHVSDCELVHAQQVAGSCQLAGDDVEGVLLGEGVARGRDRVGQRTIGLIEQEVSWVIAPLLKLQAVPACSTQSDCSSPAPKHLPY